MPRIPLLPVLCLTAATALPSLAAPTDCKPERPELAARAKVSCAAATKTAQAKVPKGQIEASELEEEHGRLIYSFDIRSPKKTGIDEVEVDALTGKVVSVHHETPEDEAKEKAEDENSPPAGAEKR